MCYSSTTIARVVDDLNRTLFLPAIQRPFVWEPDQVIALFDSLLKGYPISSFLFWEVRPENRDNWEIYRFVERFRYGDVHNELVDPDGRDVVLVLDGQQRLTSLVVGLRGSYTGVGVVLFWPALFFLASGDHEEELSRLKGEYEALQQVAIQKECDIAEEIEAARAREEERKEEEKVRVANSDDPKPSFN